MDEFVRDELESLADVLELLTRFADVPHEFAQAFIDLTLRMARLEHHVQVSEAGGARPRSYRCHDRRVPS